jgi:hypothetical protein
MGKQKKSSPKKESLLGKWDWEKKKGLVSKWVEGKLKKRGSDKLNPKD